MRGRLSPQEKKVKDYLYQTQNGYGENDKSSRKAIRKRKASVNRSFRRKCHHILGMCYVDIELMEINVSGQPRNGWKKFADESLIERISIGRRRNITSNLQKEAIKRLSKMNKEIRFS